MGQDALEHEKQELHERFDEKILSEYELINGNGTNGHASPGATEKVISFIFNKLVLNKD